MKYIIGAFLISLLVAVIWWASQAKEVEPQNPFERVDTIEAQADSVWLEWSAREREYESRRRYLDSLLYLK